MWSRRTIFHISVLSIFSLVCENCNYIEYMQAPTTYRKDCVIAPEMKAETKAILTPHIESNINPCRPYLTNEIFCNLKWMTSLYERLQIYNIPKIKWKAAPATDTSNMVTWIKSVLWLQCWRTSILESYQDSSQIG